MRKKTVQLRFALALFALFYITLPSYFAYEINTVFPLLTASRALLIFLVLSYLFYNNRKLEIHITNNRQLKRGLITYFVLATIPNLFFLAETTEAIKEIFVIYIEELFLVWLLSQTIRSRNMIEQFLKFMAWGSFVVAIISIVGSLQGINYFSYLNTVTREVAIANFSRLGFLRAEAGFGHAVHYSLYGCVIITIVMYLYEKKSKYRNLYLMILIVDIFAFILANSRGSMLALGMVIVIRLLEERKHLVQFFKNHTGLILIIILGLVVAFLVMPRIWKLMGNIIESLVIAIFGGGGEFEDYGYNINGFHSRTFQITGVYWVLTHSPLIGMGPVADGRGLIQYLNDSGNWYVTNSYDVGYFSIICNFGIIGATGYLVLMVSIVKLIKRVEKRKEPMGRMFKYAFLAYFLCYLSSVGVDKLFWVLVGLLIAYDNVLSVEEKAR